MLYSQNESNMPTTRLIFLLALLAAMAGCVQKTYRKTVVYTLHTQGVAAIERVGLRGNDKPLSWQSDTPLEVVTKDTLYRVAISYLTGYRFTEAKFSINGEFELTDSPNRRIVFSEGDTTFYDAVFNVPAKK
jgi:hypothetical protein